MFRMKAPTTWASSPSARPNPETHDWLFLPTPKKLGYLLASIYLPLTPFTMTTTPPGHFFEKSGGMLNFPGNNYEILSTVEDWIRNWRLDWKHAHCLSFTLYSNFLTANYISSKNSSDISRNCPIRPLTLNCFSFVMELFVMFVIATISRLTGSGMRRSRKLPFTASASKACLFYSEE